MWAVSSLGFHTLKNQHNEELPTHTLREQTMHKAHFLHDHVCAAHDLPVVVLGHSIGAYMAVKALRQLEAVGDADGGSSGLPGCDPCAHRCAHAVAASFAVIRGHSIASADAANSTRLQTTAACSAVIEYWATSHSVLAGSSRRCGPPLRARAQPDRYSGPNTATWQGRSRGVFSTRGRSCDAGTRAAAAAAAHEARLSGLGRSPAVELTESAAADGAMCVLAKRSTRAHVGSLK